MHRFFKSDDFSDLKSELRTGRPAPPSELLDDLATRVQGLPAGRPAKRTRLAVALVFAVVVLVALAAFGGTGYATSSISSAAKNCKHAFTSVAKRSHDEQGDSKQGDNNQGRNTSSSYHGDDDDPPWTHELPRFVLVCYPFTVHNRTFYRTIVVSVTRLSQYIEPGGPGTSGRCGFGSS